MAGQDSLVRLHRDSFDTPWGIRLQGGTDFKVPLSIQRVFVGSPADGELHRGDVILAIQNYDASQMTHKQAQDVIKKTGGTLSLRVRRAAQVRGAKTPPPAPSYQSGQTFASRPPSGHFLPKASPTRGAFNPSPNQTQNFPLRRHSAGGATFGHPSKKAQSYRPFKPQPAAPVSQPFKPKPSPMAAPFGQVGQDYTHRPPTGSMLSRVNLSLSQATGQPEDVEYEEQRPVRDLKQQFGTSGPGHGYRPAQPQRRRAWHKPDPDTLPAPLKEPGWTPPRQNPYAFKPMCDQIGSEQSQYGVRPEPLCRPEPTPHHRPQQPSHHRPQQQQQQQQQQQVYNPYQSQQPIHHEEPGPPAWSGTLRSSGGPKPWEVHQAGTGEGPAQQVSPAPCPQPVAKPAGPTVTPHQPKVQNVHYGPDGTQEYQQHGGDHESDTARVVHAQYNTPIGLYSKDNVQDVLQSQTAGKPGEGTLQVSGGGPNKDFNPAQSSVYMAIMQEEQERKAGRHRPKQWQDPHANYSPSMQALDSRYGHDNEMGTSDF